MRLFVFLLSTIPYVIRAQTGLTVHTQQGDVIGSLVSPAVRQYLGVPFAVANRWEAPTAPPVRQDALNATTFGDSCLQALTPANLEFLKLAGWTPLGINVPESENCLSVNIWSPSVDRKQNTAVMLWVYGGSSQFGTSNFAFYHAQNIVRDNDDVTVVTFNYRTNIFGQPNAPQLFSTTKSQNFGLLDLDAAVQWVHDNIAAFGGDPNRIILFGESAGGIAVDAYTFAHPKDTIVKGVIQQSGNIAALVAADGHSTTIDPTAWNTIAGAVGCGTANTAQQFACMKAVPARTLENAVTSLSVTFSLTVDDIYIFSDTSARGAAGNFLKVPILAGNNADEGNIFVIGAEELGFGFAIPGSTEVWSATVTSVFICSAVKAVNTRRLVGLPTWRYFYHAIFPNLEPRSDLGSFHASEIPIVFGSYNSSLGGSSTKTEVAFSKYVQGAWVAFARDPARGLLNYGWPTYNPNTFSLANLGGSANPTGASFSADTIVDFNCANYNAFIAAVAPVWKLLGFI